MQHNADIGLFTGPSNIIAMPFKTIAKELIFIIGIAVVTAWVINTFSPKGIALIGEWDTSKGVITAKAKDDPVSHDIEIDDVHIAKRIYDEGEAVFVDARVEEDYAQGHIKGAISFPAHQFEDYIEDFKNLYPPEVMVIIYCSGRECDDSHVLAQQLLDEGYIDVKVFIDGYPAWEKEGYPIE